MPRALRRPAPRNPTKSPKADWERDQFSVRLTRTRREALQRIVSAMPPGSTPGDAVDRAIELASAPPPARGPAHIGDDSRLEDLEELVERIGQERRGAEGALLAQGARALDALRSIASLISAVASSGLDTDPEGASWEPEEAGETREVMSLRAWLDQQASAEGRVDVIGRWRSKSRLSVGLLALELEVAPAHPSGLRSVARVEPIATGNPFAQADAHEALSLACRREPGGSWIVAVRPLRPDRTHGPEIGVARI